MQPDHLYNSRWGPTLLQGLEGLSDFHVVLLLWDADEEVGWLHAFSCCPVGCWSIQNVELDS